MFMVSLLEKVVGFVCDRNYSGDLKINCYMIG